MSHATSASALFGQMARRALKPDFNPFFFESPSPAGRRITAGFSWMQRLGRAASMDVWFPQMLKKELDELIASGGALGDEHFPAEWAAVRQFELLQDAGNYKIYNMQPDYLARSLYELTKNMRGGGYRVTVATVGSYGAADHDELEILDKRLQARLSHIIHMLYLEDQSADVNRAHDAELAEGKWDLATALPHVGMTLGARDLFRPLGGGIRPAHRAIIVPPAPHRVEMPGWVAHLDVRDAATDDPLRYVAGPPVQDAFTFRNGVYGFARADEGREVVVSYMRRPLAEDGPVKLSMPEKKHRLAQQFFKIVGSLPQSHIVHDTALGLQLPEVINENEWLYIPESDESMQAFNVLLKDVFRPLDVVSLSTLDGRADAKPEIKPTTQHLRGYGDRFTPEAQQFQTDLARYVL